MRFRLLGVVDAVSGDQPVSLGHARLRCVLAALLVDTNSFVTVDQLMERVWAGRPPQRGREVLYSYLSRLRTILSTEPEVTIERRSRSYRLTVDEASVDLHQFRSLIKDARLADENWHALALFDQALHLWRGTPFADLDTPWLGSVRAALEIERTAAELDRTDAALRCGQHAQLLAELTTRAAAQPFDERITGQLMLALAGAGRQTDALAAYQLTRQALLEQLGLEPGPELRQVHQHLLTGDGHPVTAHRAPVSSAGRSEVVVPRQLPARSSHFTGRADALKSLTDLIGQASESGSTVVISAIDGMAGVGKTALAVHAAHQVADRFPDGILFADLRGFTPDAEPEPPEQVLDHLLRGLGVAGPQIPPDLEGRSGLYRSVLADRKVLIVLDNAVNESQLEPLLPATPGCPVIVTSRRHLAGLDDATHLTLSVLDPATAAELLHSLAGDRVAPADHGIVEEIVALCGRLPLAIRIAAARLRLTPTGTPATLHAELSDALDTGRVVEWLSDGHRVIGATLAVSYRHLTTRQQHAFALVGLHSRPDVGPYAVAALANTSVADATRLLDELYAANLVQQPSHRRYALHDLIAAYARTLAADLPGPERRGALHRLYDYYAATTSRAVNTLRPWDAGLLPEPPATRTPTPAWSRPQDAQAWLESEIDTLLITALHAADQQRADHTLHQSATLCRYLRSGGFYSMAIALHEAALRQAQLSGDRDSMQGAFNSLGDIHHLQGHNDQAKHCFERALRDVDQVRTRCGDVAALTGLGAIYDRRGHYTQAAEHYELALAGARQINDHAAEQEALIGLGHVHYAQGRLAPAIDCLEQALAGARDIGNQSAEQDALILAGYVLQLQGRHATAAEYFQQALASTHKTGSRPAELNALTGLGDVHRAQDHHSQAIDCFEQVLAGARQIGDRGMELNGLIGLSHTYYGRGWYEQAIDHFQQTLANARQGDFRGSELGALRGLSDIYYRQGQLTRATEYAQQALDGARDADDRNAQFEAHQRLGRIHHATNNYRDSLDHHRVALELATDLHQPADQIRAHDGLAHAHQSLSDPGQARSHWQAALDLLGMLDADVTDEPEITAAAIRTHLVQLQRTLS